MTRPEAFEMGTAVEVQFSNGTHRGVLQYQVPDSESMWMVEWSNGGSEIVGMANMKIADIERPQVPRYGQGYAQHFTVPLPAVED